MTVAGGEEFVSRETLDVLHQLERMAKRWNPRINLVAKSTLPDFFNRHIADAFPLVQHAPRLGTWVDLGSGGGFPGLVIAAIERDARDVVLVESDARKCAFLNTARRELGLTCRVISKRIEETPRLSGAVISARALAPLPKLLTLAVPHSLADSVFLFPKGVRWEEEVMEAERDWQYDLQVIDRPDSEGSVILKIKNVRRR